MKKIVVGSLLSAVLSLVIVSEAYARPSFAIHGYLRNRIEWYYDLDAQKPNANVNQGGLGDNDRFGNIMFAQQRFRVDPMIKINDWLSIHSQIDVLDNIVFGTKTPVAFNFQSPIIGTIQIPGAGGTVSIVGPDNNGEFEAFDVRRVYGDILTAFGKFRIGRQGSQWGMGIFQNDGNCLNCDFGDSFDRFLFLSSVELSQLEGDIIKKEDHIVSFGGLVDIAFDDTQDPRDLGLGGSIQGPSRKLWQFAAFGLYDMPDFSFGLFAGVRWRNGVEGDTTTEASSILVNDNGTPILDSQGNFQDGPLQPAGQDGDTLLYYADLYARAAPTKQISLEGEFVFMNGQLSTGVAIDAIPLNGLPANAQGPIELPAQSDMRVYMGAFQAKGDYDFGRWVLQAGYASGDAQPLSQRVTQFGFRPDYQIALLLFHVPIGSSPRVSQANGDGQGSRVLVGAVPVTGNFINNAIYGTIGYDHKFDMGKFFSDTMVGLKIITAWAPANNFDVNFAEITGFADLPTVVNSNKWYGLEVDASFQFRAFEHFIFSLTGGFLYAGPAYDVEVQVFNPTNLAQINSIPFDGADNVWGVESVMIWEF